MKIRRQQKGFSLAEVLISLTVVSIMLAVAAPVLTKKSVGDNTWSWTQSYDQTQFSMKKHYTGNGTIFDGDSAVIGKHSIPQRNELINRDYFSTYTGNADIKTTVYESINNFHEENIDSKLSIIKPLNIKFGTIQPLASSQISFFNVKNGINEYVGRLASDGNNLALGVGSLQTLTNDGTKNTAIGHYTLANNTTGDFNTALGYGALLNNTTDSNNTAIGYMAGANNEGSQNTIIGNHRSLRGEEHVVQRIGGDNNLIIGNHNNNYTATATAREWGRNNILIGHNAGRGIPSNWNNNNVLAIGNVDLNGNDDQKVELIQAGEIQNRSNTTRRIVINGDLVIRSKDGTRTLFKVDGSGVPIDVSGNTIADRFASIYEGTARSTTNGPNRCEGAEICIAKFKSNKLSVTTFTCTYSGTKEKYDIYVKGGVASRKNNNNNALLRDNLIYFDECKESLGIINKVLGDKTFENLGSKIFGEAYDNPITNVLAGIGDIAGNVIEGILNFFGISTGTAGSDARLKNIYGDSTAGLKEINALKIKNYTYKADKTKTPHVGVIAQELQKVFPNSVFEGPDGYLRIKQEEMFYAMVKAIQEISDKNNKATEKIAMYKEQIDDEKQQNILIEQENKLLEEQNKELIKQIKKLK